MVTLLPDFRRLCLLTLLILVMPNAAIGQITPDRTLPTNSQVPAGCTACTVRGGTSRGSNLFHSFRAFSVRNGSSVYFDQAASIRNILVRVTGESRSQIDGLIRANGTANLFLLNPNGITFGANAQLAIGGSFLASTARSLQFADGSEFSAVNPQAPGLLAIQVPIGLQYGANPGSIQVQGTGHGLALDISAQPIAGFNAFATFFKATTAILDPSRDQATIARLSPSGLSVAPGQTLALVGGNVDLAGGTLTAEAGRVELGSVRANQWVALLPGAGGWQLDYGAVRGFGDITLAQAAAVDVSGPGSGTVQMQGRQITLDGGSAVFGLTRGNAPGGLLQVRATAALTLRGTTPDALNPQGDAIRSQITTISLPETTGRGGDIEITAARLIVQNDAQGIVTLARGSGNGGDIRVASETIDLSLPPTGQAAAGILAGTGIRSTGNAGSITVTTGRLQLSGGGQVNASTLGLGRGGDVTIQARDRVDVYGGTPDRQVISSISSNTFLVVFPEGPPFSFSPVASRDGAGGNVRVQTRRLSIQDSGQITATTTGTGQGGNLSIRAAEVEITGGQRLVQPDGVFAAPSLLATASNQAPAITSGGVLIFLGSPPGASGDLTVDTGRLTLQAGGTIATRTMGAGNGGRLTIQAREAIEVAGRSSDGFLTSRIISVAEPGSTGQAGDIQLTAQQLTVRDAAEVSASSIGLGNAGQVNLTVSDRVQLASSGAIRSVSGSEAVRSDAIGSGGRIQITAGSLELSDRSLITAQTFTAAPSGNLEITVDNLAATTGGQLLVSTAGSGKAGDIRVQSSGPITLTGPHTGLFANTAPLSTGTGGSVEVTARSLTVRDRAGMAVGSQGSGKGGNLTLQTAGRITLDDRAFLSAETTNSQGGNIAIATPEILLLRHNSLISTTAGTEFGGGDGGNVTIAAGFVVGARPENSDIRANAFTGAGGSVALTAQGVYGLQFQPQPTVLSDITASSEFGVSGTVRLNTIDLDPSQGTIVLPSTVSDPSQQIVQTCAPLQRGSSFVITGRGGLSPTPTEILNATPVWTTGATEGAVVQAPSSETAAASPARIVEASNWVRQPDGSIVLVASRDTLEAAIDRTALCPAQRQEQ